MELGKNLEIFDLEGILHESVSYENISKKGVIIVNSTLREVPLLVEGISIDGRFFKAKVKIITNNPKDCWDTVYIDKNHGHEYIQIGQLYSEGDLEYGKVEIN